MAFVLGAERLGSPAELAKRFDQYRDYLRANEPLFPKSAFALAMSDWYYSFDDRRAPHDAWLVEARLTEVDMAKGGIREIGLRVRLLNAFHDRYLDFTYPRVIRYALDLEHGVSGHRDWRYDELRLSEDGYVEHEIEWAGPRGTARWLIVASDVILTEAPLKGE